MQSLEGGIQPDWRPVWANRGRARAATAGEAPGARAQRVRRSLEDMILERVVELEPAPPGRHYSWVARTADAKFFIYNSRAEATALARSWQRDESTRRLCEDCVGAEGEIDLGRLFAVDGREIKLAGGAIAYMVGMRRGVERVRASASVPGCSAARERPLAFRLAPVPAHGPGTRARADRAAGRRVM